MAKCKIFIGNPTNWNENMHNDIIDKLQIYVFFVQMYSAL